jgi:hypothetical protein
VADDVAVVKARVIKKRGCPILDRYRWKNLRRVAHRGKLATGAGIVKTAKASAPEQFIR